MASFVEARKNLLKKRIDLESLPQLQGIIEKFIRDLPKKEYEVDELEALIYLALDYYTFSQTGDVLMVDADYDRLTKEWLKLHEHQGDKSIIFPDPITKQWEFVEHEEPGMVGSLSKVYDIKELKKWLDPWKGYQLLLAPKFDGVSVSVKVVNGKAALALTRYDGIKGQNITSIIQNVHNTKTWLASFWEKEKDIRDGYYKCEIVMTTSDYHRLCEEKHYANRRSATSGIVNTPSNLPYAKYLTLIPLLYYGGKETHEREFVYNPPMAVKSKATEVVGLYEDIEKMLRKIKTAEFEVRTDGVVIVPGKAFFNYKLNEFDYMEQCIAYKLNQEFSFTEIDFGYMSIGRSGMATPMLRVKPVEVNETEVEDVSLSSWDKYLGMDLHEGETVRVFSAGDVIPQAEPADPRQWPTGADRLKILKRCPYCEEKLELLGREYYCTNPDCIRVITGRIADFLDKMGCVGISDATVEDLYKGGLIHDIVDLFSLPQIPNMIAELPGYGKRKAEIIIREIEELMRRDTPLSKLLGSLGIRGIAEKKCARMLEYVNFDYLMTKNATKIAHRVLEADGVGVPTAETFGNFIVTNREMIQFLASQINLTKEVHYKYNVVFTGFRDPALVKKFQSIGYDVTSSVTNKTIAVIAANTNQTDSHKSGSYTRALQKGITIVDRKDVDMLLNQLDDRYAI